MRAIAGKSSPRKSRHATGGEPVFAIWAVITRHGLVLNHRPLELSKHAHHLKHRLPGGCRGVEPLLAQEEVDLERVQRRCTQVAPYTYLLDEGERLRPVDQPRELFGDHP